MLLLYVFSSSSKYDTLKSTHKVKPYDHTRLKVVSETKISTSNSNLPVNWQKLTSFVFKGKYWIEKISTKKGR